MSNPIRNSMDRVAECCIAWLDADKNYAPTGGYEVAHDTGRWWDAMLRWEAATGQRIPKKYEQAMMENLRAMTDNPLALLTLTPQFASDPEKDKLNTHNIRETMLAYTELVRHRDSDWARKQGRTLVRNMGELLRPEGRLDYDGLQARMDGKPISEDPLTAPEAAPKEWFDATASTGRAIEAFLYFHDATGDEEALALAQRLAEVQMRTIIEADGKVCPELLDSDHVGHNHSYCGTLRGLLLYGLASGKKEYVDAVAKTYSNGLWGTTISHSGWTPHDLGTVRFPNEEGEPQGEHGSCSDVMQLGLWLGLRVGLVNALDDVERLIRARLLPSQMETPENKRYDGAWGVYHHPFGYGCILDVFAAVLHSLVDVNDHIVTTSKDGDVSVNLLFNCDTDAASLESNRGEAAKVVVTPKRNGNVRIRVPGWASRESVRLSAADEGLPLRWEGAYLLVDAADAAPGQPIVLEHDLPKKETVEVMPVSGRKFTLSWRGDEVVACEPQVPIYT